MALKDLLDLSQQKRKIGLSEERVRAIIPEGRQWVAFWREYPDIFVDFLCNGYNKEREEQNKSQFQFYFYQRVFLRVAMRYKYTYMVFPRAWTGLRAAIEKLWANFFNWGNPKLYQHGNLPAKLLK